MREVGAAPSTSDPNADRRKLAIILSLGIPAYFFLLFDVLGLFSGGGLFSIVRALRLADRGADVIDVDNAGLRTIIFLVTSLFAMAAMSVLRVDLNNKLTSFLVFTPIIIFGFTIDVMYDQRIVSDALATRGYRRCAARDYHVGHGKGQVWFDVYLPKGRDCRRAIGGGPVIVSIPRDPRSNVPRQAKPIYSLGAWFTDDTYPAAAVRRRAAGRVVVRFVVEPSGRVDRCVTLISSRSTYLDAATCAVLVENARYWPARNVHGRAIPEPEVQAVRWILPNG